ncbi:M14 family metallopeptidase [Neobacillus niacini]|uniref:M14 family metallopeptidase n=1 Tax=Neobacillus niacini TaxID=86668 RepID=UPI00285B5CAC|nr:M14 family metallopeptidase [Neobacillus niacini]MDR6998739.1 g-D-glutamyl-meso-diaminopimelate peptidase [Neobacillus niacini]
MEVLFRSEDSLWYYSRLFMVPVSVMEDSNPDINPKNVEISKKIIIPGYEAVPYRIKNGDTLAGIAASKNLPLDALFLLNQTHKPNQLFPNETILIPERVTMPFLSTTKPCCSANLYEAISYLKRVYPFINVSVIGKSVLGNPIHEIRIGRGTKKVHMNASFHANEWITTLILMDLLNHFLLSITNGIAIRGVSSFQLYQNIELSIVPMVNPDGVDLVVHGPPDSLRGEVMKINNNSDDFIHWKANIRGVDLNNQYPAKWEIEKERKLPKLPASRDFPGNSPLTEPEAIAMAELAKSNPFDCVVAFHTQGEEFYWGYEGYEPPEAGNIAKAMERLSGYKAIQYVDSHAGYKDWYIQEFKRPGFTIELGRGINPLPLSRYKEIYSRAEAIFIAVLLHS